MTAKEKLHRLVDGLSEQEAGRALELISSRRPGVDGWGDLDAMTDATTAEVMRSLDAEERRAGLEPWQP